MGRRFHPVPRWTPGQRRALERAAAAGKLETVTARQVRRSAGAVKAKRDRMGLPKAPEDPRQDRIPGLPPTKPLETDDQPGAGHLNETWNPVGRTP